jgi:hypothetical protein
MRTPGRLHIFGKAAWGIGSGAIAVIVLLATAGLLEAASFIHGYASTTSVPQGSLLRLHLRTLIPQLYDIEIVNALDPEQVLTAYRGLNGVYYPIPDSAYANGCGWPVRVTVPVNPAWPSGVYYARLVMPAVADTAFVIFTVRENVPGSTSNILFQCSFNTYQAYNNWGGKSLYDHNSEGGQRAYWVSYDRPFGGLGKGQFETWEAPLAAWLRDEGMTVEFCTNVDLDENPALLDSYDLLLSVGHDEYWSKGMRDGVEAFRDAGGNLAFFSGNSCHWAVRLENDGRRLVCYKDYQLDPYYAMGLLDEVTDLWRNFPLLRPEAALIGVHYEIGDWRAGGVPLRPSNVHHWCTRGLGLAVGEALGVDVVGYEWDRHQPEASPPTTQIMMTSPVENHLGEMRVQHSTYYDQLGSGPGSPRSGVFAAGTIQWSYGLAGPGADARLQAITRRVIGCLRSPPGLEEDRPTIFRVDLSHQGATPEAVWLHGRTPPLSPEKGVRLLDDGMWPDELAADKVFSTAVTFASGSWPIVEYWYETTGPCTPAFFSAWIDDPETMVAGNAVLATDQPDACPVVVAVGENAGDQADGALRAAVRPQGAAGVTLVLSVPNRLVGKALRVSIHDAAGRLRAVVAEIAATSPRESFVWTGRDASGREVARGLYFARVQVGGEECRATVPWLE